MMEEHEGDSNDSPLKHMRMSGEVKPMPKESSEECKSPVNQLIQEESESSEYKQLMKKANLNTEKAKKRKKPFSIKGSSKKRPLHSELNSAKSKKKKKFIFKKSKNKTSSTLNEECTFEPRLNKNSLSMAKKSIVSSNIQHNWTSKTPISHKLSREIEDLKECSFTPNIAKTKKLYQTPESGVPCYEKLYSKHKSKIIKLEARSRKKKETEILECTFIPKVRDGYMSQMQFDSQAQKEREKVKDRGNSVKVFRNTLLEDGTPSIHDKLYDSGKTAMKRRRNELISQKEAHKSCTFQPEKLSGLEFQYLDQYKEPHLRLYNNYFEVQEKLSSAQEYRNKELKAMSEPRAHSNINVSITNNYIGSSINYSTRGKSTQDSKFLSYFLVHTELYEMNKQKDRKRKSLEERVNYHRLTL